MARFRNGSFTRCIFFLLATQALVSAQTPADIGPDDQPQNAVPPGKSASASLDRRDSVFYEGDTERPWPLFRKLGRNVLLDQKGIWTSPFRMHRQDAKWWLTGTVITAALVATDRHSIKTF